MQALILAGGEGTRLRPITSTMPKPVVPLANRPHLELMISWLRRHGVDEVILSCGFLADGVREVLGTGERLGIPIRYVEEPTPLGTGGALRFAGELLADRFFMLNGDVLTDIDLTAQLAQHEETGARATIALIGVDDPSAYGLVRRNPDHSVSEFLEKPSPDQIDTNLINAGAYILDRSILDEMPPPGSNISIERDVFPKLVGSGSVRVRLRGLLDRHRDPRPLPPGDVRHPGGQRAAPTSVTRWRGLAACWPTGSRWRAARWRRSSSARASTVAASATVGGRAVLGRNVTVGPGSHIEDAVLLDGVTVGSVDPDPLGHRRAVGDDRRPLRGRLRGRARGRA